MPFEVRLVLGLLFAIGAVYSLTPVAIRMAARFEFYDKPAGYKGHGRPTPYLGGAALVTGFALVLLIAAGSPAKTLPLLAGMGVLLVVGTIDDRLNISPLARVVVEAAMAALLWAADLGWHLGAGGALDLVLTIAWVVAVVNALNLFDNMDGAASTMAGVVAAIVVLLGVTHDDQWLAVTAAVLLGACVGFLPHNMASPARVFLGDGGSMPVGFGVAALVMVGSSEAAPAGQALLLGLMLVGVPAADTCMVVISRRRRGIGVLTGGRDHLTHRTRQWLRTARAVAMGLGAVQALVSVLAVFAIRGGSAAFMVILVLYLVAGATAIAFLETRYEETVDYQAAAAAPAGLGGLPITREPGLLLAGAFGAALGLTPFFSGLYSEGRWVPIGLLLLIVTTVVAIARPVRLSRPQMLTLGGLVGIGLWGLISALWAPSIAQATTNANRWLVLAAICASAIVLIRSERAARWLAGGLAAGVIVVASYSLVALLADPGSVLLGGRLNQPLGYVNAEGTTFLMGFWLCFGLVEHHSRRVASVGLGLATAMAGLVLLTESRGAAVAMVASLLVVAALPGRRTRRIFGLLGIALAISIVSGPLLSVYRSVGAPDDCRRAALALIGISIAAGFGWWLAHAGLARLATERPALGARLPRVGVLVLAVLALAGGATALAAHDSIGTYVSDQWTAFVKLSDAGTGAASGETLHLASGAGYRYDYWRVAWDAFLDRPVAGVGAGNYDRPYFRARATREDVRQPHSMLLQELSELGLVGGLFIAALAAALLWGLARAWRAARFSSAVLPVAASGVAVAWFVHTNVDWIHLIPGITGIALAVIAVLLRPTAWGEARPASPPPPPGRRRLRTRTTVAAALGSIVLVVAAVSLSRSGLATLFRDRAQSALATNPGDAVVEADRSLRLDAENPRTYYVKAAALARFDDAAGARRALEQALAKEPDNFVTWTLLGDLAVRTGDIPAAGRYYRQALRFNPTDATLQSLAADPAQAAG